MVKLYKLKRNYMKHPLPDRNALYKALLNKNPEYEGLFFAGIKTTGIFCRPTCPARKPKKENVEFFKSAREALMNGYRPCKICSPMSQKGAAPEWLKPLLEEISEKPGFRLKDTDLKSRNLSPIRIRNWFKKNHGITFQAYLRLLRVGQAFGRLKYGDKVINAAYDSGYESLSGFTDTFKKASGFSPSKSAKKSLLLTTRILTPLGPMIAGAVANGICLLEFVDRRMLETQLNKLSRIFNAKIVPGQSAYFDKLKMQLDEYFSGARTEFDVPLVTSGTIFQIKVWNRIRHIPYGKTISYKEEAESIGLPRSIRAIARANGENRIALIIPCHRVIGANGKLVGYGGGLWRKKYLLELESSNLMALKTKK
jgi:AraC family transcriptional regulator of adaptative response/methylated-DNA-[protein]-cysteine methyltransferase